MKKIMALLLVAVMMAGLVACGTDKKPTGETTSKVDKETTEVVDKETEESEATNGAEDVTEPEDETTESEDEFTDSSENDNADDEEAGSESPDETTESDESLKDALEDAFDKIKDKEKDDNKEDKKNKNDKSETSNKKIVKIEDTATPDMVFAQAIEVFHKDKTHEYYFNCIYSQCIIVTYEDGTTETIKEALNNGNISINDLDIHNIGYRKRPIGGLDKVDK